MLLFLCFVYIKHVNRLIYVARRECILQMEETLIYGLSLLREHHYLLLFGVSPFLPAPETGGVKRLHHPSVISFCRALKKSRNLWSAGLATRPFLIYVPRWRRRRADAARSGAERSGKIKCADLIPRFKLLNQSSGRIVSGANVQKEGVRDNVRERTRQYKARNY